MKIRSICVYCGHREGNSGAFIDAALAVAEELAARGIRLVYGGGGSGMMGRIAHAVLDAGGEVRGVIPRSLQVREHASTRVTQMEVVETMHERKARFHQLSDAFLTLPGGLGTLDELFETLSWGQLGIHAKPTGLLNVEGYYDPLIRMLDDAVEKGFLSAEHRRLLVSAESASGLLDLIERYEPPEPVIRWLTSEEEG